jgi:Spy/CpxP family protein refolding chaperone
MKHIILTLFLSTALAHAGPEAWLQGGLMTPDMIGSLSTELGLSSEQREKMQVIVTEATAEGVPLEKAVRERQKAFNGLLRSPETPSEQASAALTKLLEAEAPVKQLQLRTLIRLRDLLSPEQQKMAIKLAPTRSARSGEWAGRVRAKAEKLRAEIETLGITPTKALSTRGEEIESLIRAGKWQAADEALERLINDTQIDHTVSAPSQDFQSYPPGNTDLDTLKTRYETIEAKAQQLISLPMIRQFIEAKQAFEQAKQAQDADAVGRILTWAEQQLEQF